MKAAETWTPTKFVLEHGRLRANPDPKAVALSSRLNVDLLGAALGELLAKHACGRLLDLGCGSVPLYAAYREKVQSVLCVDWAQSAHGLSHVDITADLNQPLPLRDQSANTVLLTDVLEHLSSPGLLLREVARVLTPGGALVGSVPFMYRLHEEPHDHCRFTCHALRHMAQEAGLQTEHLVPYAWGTDVLFDIMGKLLLGLHWRLGPRLADWSQRLGTWVRSTSWGREINAGHESMPLGYVFVFRAPAIANSGDSS